MKQWWDARSSKEASSQRACAYEYVVLVALIMLAATHQAHSYLIDLLQSAGMFLMCVFFNRSLPPVKALIPGTRYMTFHVH